MMASDRATDTKGKPRTLKRKPGKAFWGGWTEWTISVAVILVLAFGTYKYVIWPNTLQVKRVLFQGNKVLTDQQILEAAQITESDTIFSVKREVVRQRVLELPYVRECTVSIASSAIIIQVVERVPVAALMVNNRLYEVDRGGMVLRLVPPLAQPNGPMVTNLPDLSAVTPGQRVDNPTLEQAFLLWDAFSADLVSKELTLSEISAQSENTLYMFFEELPFDTRWGRSDFPTQVHRFNLLWREKGGKLPCTEFIDMRFNNNIVCK